ncbi:MAG: hypothetical protein V1898_02205 [Patescibacteria group bacterium]
MIPIDFFTDFAQVCSDRPFLLLSQEDQNQYLIKLREIISRLLQTLEQKKLQKTHAYQIVTIMSDSVHKDYLNEFYFARALAQLDTLYGPNTKPGFLAKVEYMDSMAEKFKKRAYEFYILEQKISDQVEKLTPEQIQVHDFETLQNIGIFYILEYTLILEQEILKAVPEKQIHIINHGVQVEAGNLPGLKPLMKSFYQELAFNIYNQELRWDILRIFFDFQLILDKNEISAILKGLRKLNIELLRACLRGGLINFSGHIYKPYSDNTPIEEIINSLFL